MFKTKTKCPKCKKKIKINLEKLNKDDVEYYTMYKLNLMHSDDCHDDCEDCQTYSLEDYDTYEIIEHLADNGYDIIKLLTMQRDIVTQALLKDFIATFNRIPREELQKLIDKYK